jgi:hypothetical protein
MSWVWQAGGFPMYFVLGFGLIALGAALFFAAKPDARRVDSIRALTWATLFSIFGGIVSDIAAVGTKVPNNPEWANNPKIHLIVMEGIAESMAPGILGFTLLSLVWMVMAVGHRRLARDLPLG